MLTLRKRGPEGSAVWTPKLDLRARLTAATRRRKGDPTLELARALGATSPGSFKTPCHYEDVDLRELIRAGYHGHPIGLEESPRRYATDTDDEGREFYLYSKPYASPSDDEAA
jgi:hypothetical protein